MARRKSKAKQEEELIQGITGLIVFVCFFGTYGLTKSMTAAGIMTGVGIAGFIGVMVALALRKREKLRLSGIADIDQMDGVQFESYLGLLFQQQGYQASVTRSTGDFGADLVLQKDGKRIVVQAKRYKKNVGIDAVQQVQASINHYSAQEAWVVTNSYYTDAAEKLAASNKVKLINRDDLIEMIVAMNPQKMPRAKQVMNALPPKEMSCDRCGSKMVLRKSSKGQFYGCSTFPKCRNMVEV